MKRSVKSRGAMVNLGKRTSSARSSTAIVAVVLVVVLAVVGLCAKEGVRLSRMANASVTTTLAPSRPTVTPSPRAYELARSVTTKPVRPSGTIDGLPALLPSDGPTVHAPILMYHHVADQPATQFGPQADWLTVRTKDFESQAAYLSSHAITTVTFRDLYLGMSGSFLLSGHCAILTFDDGGEDVYTSVFPILKKNRLTASIFVITGKIDQPGYLTWEQLREMQMAGMSIESHTVSHPNLTAVDDTRLTAELVDSKKAIEEHLGVTPVVVAYPGGTYDKRVEKAARDAGYLMAVTTNPGKDSSPGDPFALPRVPVYPSYSLERFRLSAE